MEVGRKMEIRNFFLKKEVFDLGDLTNSPLSYIGGVNNEFMVEVVKTNKKKYVEAGMLNLEGGIIFKVGYKEVGGIPIFDDLATLYAYYVNAIEELLDEEVANFYYPSQSIEVRLEKNTNGKTKISIDNQELLVSTDLLLNMILSNSESFFNILVNELGLKKYVYELKQIELIKEKLV